MTYTLALRGVMYIYRNAFHWYFEPGGPYEYFHLKLKAPANKSNFTDLVKWVPTRSIPAPSMH